MMSWPLKNPIRLEPHTMLLLQATFVPQITSVPQMMLSRSEVPQMMLSTSVPQMMLSWSPDVPQTMLSFSSLVPQMMLSSSPVPQTTFCAHACWLTSMTAEPETTLVPQMMSCTHGTFSVPYSVFGSIGVVIHLEPTGCEVRSEERRVGKERRSRWSPY